LVTVPGFFISGRRREDTSRGGRFVRNIPGRRRKRESGRFAFREDCADDPERVEIGRREHPAAVRPGVRRTIPWQKIGRIPISIARASWSNRQADVLDRNAERGSELDQRADAFALDGASKRITSSTRSERFAQRLNLGGSASNDSGSVAIFAYWFLVTT